MNKDNVFDSNDLIVIANKYEGWCIFCRNCVDVGKGFAFKYKSLDKASPKWQTACTCCFNLHKEEI
jgi:hypothetical protein